MKPVLEPGIREPDLKQLTHGALATALKDPSKNVVISWAQLAFFAQRNSRTCRDDARRPECDDTKFDAKHKPVPIESSLYCVIAI
jgi:hypothetical protein